MKTAGQKEGAGLLERAAQLVEGWHISKGGYTELARRIRELANSERPADWLDGTNEAVEARGDTACGATDPAPPRYGCTRPPDHAGEHRAFGIGTEPYSTWPRKVVGSNG